MSLADSAVLVRTTFRKYNALVKDPRLEREVESNAHAKRGKTQVKKRTLSEWKEKREMDNIISTTYITHRDLTLAWTNDGDRILASTIIDEYCNAIREASNKVEAQKQILRDTYEAAVENDKKEVLRGLVENYEYPTIDEIVNSYSIDSFMYPVPDTGDFRVSLPQHELEKTKKKFDVENSVNKELLNDVHQCLKEFKDRLLNSERFHANGWIEKVNALANRTRAKNVYNKGEIVAIADALRNLVDGVRPDVLRVSESSKQDLANEVGQFLNDYKDIF